MIKAQQKLIIVIAAVLVALLVAYFAVVLPIVNKTEEVTTEPLVTVEGEIAGANGRYQIYAKHRGSKRARQLQIRTHR